jgi:transcriptional regulator with XRE-family HTH domain
MPMNEIDRQLGEQIRSLREQRHITQAVFGKALGLDQSAVSRIEDGSRSLTAGELASASSVLGVTVATLLEEGTSVPALLRVGDSDDEAVLASLRIFNECIDGYRGVEALAG